jgi:hypothetical protein
VAVLDPDVVGDSTLIGRGPLAHVEGRDNVARRTLQLFGPHADRLLIPVPIEDTTGIVAYDHDRVLAVIKLDERDGLVHHIQALVRPDALIARP